MHTVCSEEEWQTLISEDGWDSVQLRDARYDQIIHMVTAANGAEAFYQVTAINVRCMQYANVLIV